jgi:hypothetical protein
MLAHALLTVIAAHEHDKHPAPVGMIELTRAKIGRLIVTLVIDPHARPGLSVRMVAVASRPPTPGPATTSAIKPPAHGYNDLRLEY